MSEEDSAITSSRDFELREQDKWLPIANVSRIMKHALPENAKVSKEAKECVQECVSEFVSFITSEASDKCQAEKRKTVNGEDILFAMTSLGFENYAEVLKIYLAKYRESQMLKQDRKASASSGAYEIEGNIDGNMDYDETDRPEPAPEDSRETKKIKAFEGNTYFQEDPNIESYEYSAQQYTNVDLQYS